MKKNTQVALKSKKNSLQNVSKNNTPAKGGVGLKAKQNAKAGGNVKNAGNKLLIPPKKVVEDEDDDEDDDDDSSDESAGANLIKAALKQNISDDDSSEDEDGQENAEDSDEGDDASNGKQQDDEDDDDDDDDDDDEDDKNVSRLVTKANGSKIAKKEEEDEDDDSDDDDDDDEEMNETQQKPQQGEDEESNSSDDEAPAEKAIDKKQTEKGPQQKGGETVQKRKVFVKRLHPNTLESHIRKHFATCGEIASLILRGIKGSKGEATIIFADEAASQEALKLHNSILNDSTILVQHATHPRPKLVENCSAILKNTDGLTKLEGSKVTKLFSKCGEIESMSIVCEKNVLAYLSFKVPEGLQKAMQLNGTQGDGFKVELSPYSERSKKTRVFVKNIAKGVTEDDVTKMFKACGEVSKVILRQNDPMPATAVVQFANQDGYCKAFMLHEEKLRGQSIYLEPFSSKPNPKKFQKKPQFLGKRPASTQWKKGPPKKFTKTS